MQETFHRRKMTQPQLAVIGDKKAINVISSSSAVTKRFPREIFSRGSRNRIVLCHNPTGLSGRKSVDQVIAEQQQNILTPRPTFIDPFAPLNAPPNPIPTKKIKLRKIPEPPKVSFLPQILLPHSRLGRTDSVPEDIMKTMNPYTNIHSMPQETEETLEETKTMDNSNHNKLINESQINNLEMACGRIEDTPRFVCRKSRNSLNGLAPEYSAHQPITVKLKLIKPPPAVIQQKPKHELYKVKPVPRPTSERDNDTLRRTARFKWQPKMVPDRSKSKKPAEEKIKVPKALINRVKKRGLSQGKLKKPPPDAVLEFEKKLKETERRFLYTSIPWKGETEEDLCNLTFGEKQFKSITDGAIDFVHD